MSEPEFIECYDAFSDALFRHCYFRVHERERAKDLVQEAFIRVWDYGRRGNKLENARAFLYRVVNNLIIDESRKKRSLSLDGLAEQGFDPADKRAKAGQSAEVSEVLRTLRFLPEEQRQLIVFRYIDDLGPKEIAEIINESENVVSVRLHRAIAAAKKLLHAHAA